MNTECWSPHRTIRPYSSTYLPIVELKECLFENLDSWNLDFFLLPLWQTMRAVPLERERVYTAENFLISEKAPSFAAPQLLPRTPVSSGKVRAGAPEFLQVHLECVCVCVYSGGLGKAVLWNGLPLHVAGWASHKEICDFCAKSLQLCLTLCGPVDCSPPGSFVCEILQARIREWVVISYSRGPSQSRD